ncbi:hypothetical protein BXZ70DRAFT_432560, partial [Cristinia sonorae]
MKPPYIPLAQFIVRQNLLRQNPLNTRQNSSRSSPFTSKEVDEHCIPIQPTWSVTDLLSSYPRPNISEDMLDRIHTLSALIPPTRTTPEHRQLTAELENLVKLVDAVKLVDKGVFGEEGGRVPDGRVWADDVGIDLSIDTRSSGHNPNMDGRSLLQHAARTANGLYVVEADKPKGSGR